MLLTIVIILINANYKDKCEAALKSAIREKERSLQHTIDFDFPEYRQSMEIREVAEYKFHVEYPSRTRMIIDTPTVYSTVYWKQDSLRKEVTSICNGQYDAASITQVILRQHPEYVQPIEMSKYLL